MQVRLSAYEFLRKSFGEEETFHIVMLAQKVENIEKKWRSRLETLWRKKAQEIAEYIEKTGQAPHDTAEIEKFYVEHYFEVMRESFRSTKRTTAVPTRMAKSPRSLKSLMEAWDLWRKTGKAPKKQKAMGDKIKKAYLDKVREVTKEYNDATRSGKIVEKSDLANQIMESSKAERARSNTIVETETTRYWNQTRKNTYDESEDVTHYIFVAIRDMATTKWCKTRDGLVYAKGDPILTKELPPCHWNCRSEVLPLTPLNPRHKKLIDDDSLKRRNHSPEPLPPSWNK